VLNQLFYTGNDKKENKYVICCCYFIDFAVLRKNIREQLKNYMNKKEKRVFYIKNSNCFH